MLRVVSYNVHGLRDDRGALVEVVRDLDPDVLIVQEAPRRLRWRTRCAHLAHDLDLVYVTGGAPSLGNVIMTSLRVRAMDSWAIRYPLTPGRHLRGAAFARCVADGASFVPDSRLELEVLLDVFMLGKAVYELQYEANHRPDWIGVPAHHMLELLGARS